MKFGLGESATRVEDPRFLRGRGRYTDDINLANQLYAWMVRSPHAHADILSIDSTQALTAPGVVAVFTSADLAADGIGGMPSLIPKIIALKRPDGSPICIPTRHALAAERARFVGENVAMVVARSRDEARDAAELVEVDYAPRKPVVDTDAALAPGAVAVWDDCPDNISYVFGNGDAEAVAQAIDNAAHVTRASITLSRVAMNPMEPRAAVGEYDEYEERYTLYSGNQFPHDIRSLLAEEVLHVPETAIRVVSPDMGGSFGLRSNIFPELPLVMWAAKRLGQPVKWTGDRSECLLVDDQARDVTLEPSLPLMRRGSS